MSKKLHNPSLCIVIDTRYPNKKLYKFVRSILKEVAKLAVRQTYILISMQDASDPDTHRIKTELSKEFKDNVYGFIAGDGARVYTRGLEEGMRIAGKDGIVIELDYGGAHDPKQLHMFVNALKEHDIVFSSRFIKGKNAYHPEGETPYPDGVDGYPLQRQILSRGVNELSRRLLGTGKLTDSASGYQGFRTNVLRDLFCVLPANEWFSVVQGPTHMVQTELRAIVIELAAVKRYTWVQIPIEYGIHNTGRKVAGSYIVLSLKTFYDLWKAMPAIKEKIYTLV